MASGFVKKFHHDTLPPPSSKARQARTEKAQDIVAVGSQRVGSSPPADEKESFIRTVARARFWRTRAASFIAVGVVCGFALACLVVAVIVFSR
jgi:hypothetical protein